LGRSATEKKLLLSIIILIIIRESFLFYYEPYAKQACSTEALSFLQFLHNYIRICPTYLHYNKYTSQVG